MIIKKLLPSFILLFSVFSCSKVESYDPNEYLSEDEKKNLLIQIIPYSAKLPKRIALEKRFDITPDTFYTKEVKKYGVQHYYISSEDSVHYFMLNRVAPSLYEKKIAIAGKFKKDASGNIKNYEEVFWTFKMKKEELDKKGKILFAEMVKGNNLSEYLPGKKEDEWIEFPDNRCFYDKKEQVWKVNSDNSLVSEYANP